MYKSIIDTQTKNMLDIICISIYVVSLVAVGIGCYLCATSFSDTHPVLTALFFAQTLLLMPVAIYIADKAYYDYTHTKGGYIVIHTNR